MEYSIWYRKIQYLLNELEFLETITNATNQHIEDNNRSIDVLLNLIKAGLKKIVLHLLTSLKNLNITSLLKKCGIG